MRRDVLATVLGSRVGAATPAGGGTALHELRVFLVKAHRMGPGG